MSRPWIRHGNVRIVQPNDTLGSRTVLAFFLLNFNNLLPRGLLGLKNCFCTIPWPSPKQCHLEIPHPEMLVRTGAGINWAVFS